MLLAYMAHYKCWSVGLVSPAVRSKGLFGIWWSLNRLAGDWERKGKGWWLVAHGMQYAHMSPLQSSQAKRTEC